MTGAFSGNVAREMGNVVFRDADSKDETDFDTEPPGFRKPGGGYASFSKDFGCIKTRKVSGKLPDLVVGK